MGFEIRFDRVRINPNFLPDAKIVAVCMEEVAATIANNISKSDGGKDADGRALKGYSPSYKKAIDAGRVPFKGQGATTPTLRQKGDLHESRQAVAIANGAEGRFVGGHRSGMSNAAMAGIQVGLGRDHWHEFGEEDLKRIDKRFEGELSQAADKDLVRIEKR